MADSTGDLFNTTDRKTCFVDIILPVPVPKLFTYRVPYELNSIIREGQRVVVPFGQRNVLTGVIKNISNSPPTDYEARLILDVLEETPAFNTQMLSFLDWIGSYYMANPGDVLNVALPAGLKVSSESLIQLNPNFVNTNKLASDEKLLIEHLSTHEHIGFQEITHLTGKKSNNKLIKSLLNREAIILFDKIKERFSPKTSKYIRLNPSLLLEDESLQNTFDSLEKKTKQQEVLLSYLKQLPILEKPSLNESGLKKSILLKDGCSPSSIKTL